MAPARWPARAWRTALWPSKGFAELLGDGAWATAAGGVHGPRGIGKGTTLLASAGQTYLAVDG